MTRFALCASPFIKDQDIKISAFIAGKGKELDDKFEVCRFARFQVGENI